MFRTERYELPNVWYSEKKKSRPIPIYYIILKYQRPYTFPGREVNSHIQKMRNQK